MGKLLCFPRDAGRSKRLGRGCVHCWLMPSGCYEIGHESNSGSSWGSFEKFDDAVLAVEAAYRLAQQYGSGCDVHIAPDVLAAVPATEGDVSRPGEW